MSLAAIGIAFIGGVVSFLSPCVIPLVPGYLSFISGMSITELSEQGNKRALLTPALLFVAGFTLVFVAFGASASLLGSLLKDYQTVVQIVGGLLVAVFGILMTGIIKVPWLYGEFRMDPSKARFAGNLSGLFVGMAFAAGWTPCIGPVLGAILTLASATTTASEGVVLLLSYSAGLAIPFILVAVLFSRARPVLQFVQRYSTTINRVAGAILFAIGLLIATGWFSRLALWMAGYIPSVTISLPTLPL